MGPALECFPSVRVEGEREPRGRGEEFGGRRSGAPSGVRGKGVERRELTASV